MSLEPLAIIAFLVLVVLLFLFLLKKERKRKAAITLLKEQYDKALQSGNKQAALIKGRAYYASLRNGQLTIYDEQAIANDIATNY